MSLRYKTKKSPLHRFDLLLDAEPTQEDRLRFERLS